MVLQSSFNSLVFGNTFQCIKTTIFRVTHQKYVAELPLAQFLYHLEVVQHQSFALFVHVLPLVFLRLNCLTHRNTVIDCLRKGTLKRFYYLLKCSKRDFTRLFHSELKTEALVRVIEGTLAVKLSFF